MIPSETSLDESVRTTESRGKSAFNEVLSEARGRAKDLKERYVDDAWTSSREWVRSNPGKSILISTAVGMILGGLLMRRRR